MFWGGGGMIFFYEAWSMYMNIFIHDIIRKLSYKLWILCTYEVYVYIVIECVQVHFKEQ